jgi:hypothetical protein
LDRMATETFTQHRSTATFIASTQCDVSARF